MIFLSIAATLLIGVFGYYQFNKQKSSYLSSEQAPAEIQGEKIKEVTPPKATANIDEAVSALLMDSSAELADFNEEASDGSLLNADSQEIDSLGQTYNEKEF